MEGDADGKKRDNFFIKILAQVGDSRIMLLSHGYQERMMERQPDLMLQYAHICSVSISKIALPARKLW